jgi:CRP-like cAMP-binding protein
MTVKEWLPAALHAIGVERELVPGQALFRLGDRTAGIFEVLQGQVQMVRVDASGREIILYAASAGEIFAEAALFSPVYHCDALPSAGFSSGSCSRSRCLHDCSAPP